MMHYSWRCKSRFGVKRLPSRGCLACVACAAILIASLAAFYFYERAVWLHLRGQRANISALFEELINQKPPADCPRKTCSYQGGAEAVRDAFLVKAERPYNSLLVPKAYPYIVPPEKLSRFEDQLRDLLHDRPPSRALLWNVLDLVEELSPPNYFTFEMRHMLEMKIGPRPVITNEAAEH